MAVMDFRINKNDIHQFEFLNTDMDADHQKLAAGEVLLKVDKFAFTANNITYAFMGEKLRYWEFFPAAQGWGHIPVWGFADVQGSNSEAIGAGERIYGFFPLCSHIVMRAGSVTPMSFIDTAEHRQPLPAAYNFYLRTQGDPAYAPALEGLQALLRPLFTTSFLIDDFLADKNMFNAGTVILSSASSKTAFGTAFLLNRNKNKRSPYRVVGLTSSENCQFVRSLGCYDDIVSYSDVDSLPAGQKAVYVDMAGNGQLREQLHNHYGENMVYSCQVGAAHWDQVNGSNNLPGAQPEVFFAPSQYKKRNREWGGQALQEKLGEAWLAFLGLAKNSITLVEGQGRDAIEQVYVDTLKGTVKPDKGYILSI